jgi:hypothetical protein
MLGEALRYYDLGWCVIPLKANPPVARKRSQISWKAFTRVRPDREQVEAWWRAYPEAGIALILGEVSGGVVALDFDGDGALELLDEELPPTATSITGSGGKHILFRSDVRFSTISELRKGHKCHVELRGESSIIVLPPSIHPNGTQYVWEVPPEEGIADLPAFLKDGVQQRRSTAELFRGVEAGTRNPAALRIAGQLAGQGHTRDDILNRMLTWNALNKPPLDDDEILQVVDYVIAREEEKNEKLALAGDVARPSTALQLVGLAEQYCLEFMTDPMGEAFVRYPVDSHVEVWPVEHSNFQQWMASQYYIVYGSPPNRSSLVDATLIIQEFCRRGPVRELGNRVLRDGEYIWYDLGEQNRGAVRIRANLWEIIEEPDVIFRRFSHQQQQDRPLPGGAVREILQYLNIPEKDKSRVELLTLVYLVSSFIPDIPHPILLLVGPQGSAKSNFFRLLRSVVDPSIVGVLSFPRDSQEIVQQLSHHWMAMYDNVTVIPDWLSDMLCRACTGEGMSKRKLYTDDEDILYSYRRVVGINGVVSPIERPDLLDRCIVVNLEHIRPAGPHARRTEDEIWGGFNERRPYILGACLDTVAHALDLYETIELEELPRMADFARWGAAIAVALGYTLEDFLQAYAENNSELTQMALEGYPFAQAVLGIVERYASWEGTSDELLNEAELVAAALGISTQGRQWPKTGQWVIRKLRESQTNLLDIGVEVAFPDVRGRKIIQLRDTRKRGDVEDELAYLP